MTTLTADQEAAARAGPDGAYLIAAGPGTGKTATMADRFAWLVRDCEVPSNRILAVTFTERAAAELRERVAAAVDLDGDAWISTYHGACARLLKEHAYALGMPRDLRVLDDVGQRLMLERLRARLQSGAAGEIDLDSLTALRPDDVTTLLRHGLQFVLKLKGRGIAPGDFRERALELHRGHPHDGAEQLPAAAEEEAIGILHSVYDCYERWLRDAALVDFDDLILITIRALENDAAFQARCRDLFRFILVDEFQDSNRIQLELVRLLAPPGFGNVSVVGDAKQSIYGWRDAEIGNLRSRFPGRRLPLTRNHRSHQEILDLATTLIRLDPAFADEPDLVAERGGAGAETVTVIMAAGADQEARIVAGEILRLHERGRAYSTMAILAHSVRRLPVEFERQLRLNGIPYVTSGGAGLFDREEVKDVLALLRLTEEPLDDGALARVLQGPVVRVDDDAMYRIASLRIGRRGMRLRDCWDEYLAGEARNLDGPTVERARRVLSVTDRLGRARDALTVADLLNRVLEDTGYLRHAQLRSAREGPRALLNLRKLFRMANRFERDSALAGLADFVHQLDHLMEAEIPIGEAEAEAADAVSLLTVHAAKGLEFETVFLVNTRPAQPRDSERLFFDPDGFGFVMKYWRGEKHPRFEATAPSSAAMALAREERRRTVYVALTRAKDRLYVSASRSEPSPQDIVAGEDDHFAEIMAWALANPASARVVEAEQLPLALEPGSPPPRTIEADAGAVLDRLRMLEQASPTPRGQVAPVRLSFSDLQLFHVCPARYRFSEVWRVPAPPDDLMPVAARRIATSGGELGDAVHRALQAWHSDPRTDLLAVYSGPREGEEMLRRYLQHPLSRARTLATEVGFNLRVGGTHVRGVIDRVAEHDGRGVLIDYKTNRRLDARLRAAYATQLRLYGLAADAGVLPVRKPRLVLFDLRRGEAVDVVADPEGVTATVAAAAAEIAAGSFRLSEAHADRPCQLCAYRPICGYARD